MTTERVGDLALGDGEPGAIYLLKSGLSRDNAYPKREVLHVMSKSAGGQIRGYIKHDGQSKWSVWLPCYTGPWPEMDQAVADLIGEPVIGFDGSVTSPRRPT